MKKYNIGEILSKIKEVNHVAYCVKGAMKETFISVDSDTNRLVTHYPNGFATHDFNFTLDVNMSEEDRQQWIFMNELDPNDEEYLNIVLSMNRSLITAFETFSEEDKKDIKKELNQYFNKKESGDVE